MQFSKQLLFHFPGEDACSCSLDCPSLSNCVEHSAKFSCITKLFSWWAVSQPANGTVWGLVLWTTPDLQAAFSPDQCSFMQSHYWDCSLACAKWQSVLGTCFIHSWNIFRAMQLFPLHCRTLHYINQVAQHESSADTWFSQYQCLQIVMRAINVRSHLEPLVYISAEKWALQYFALSWIIQSIRVPPIESPMLFLQESFFSPIALTTICLSFGSYLNMCLRLSQSWAHV